MKRSMMLIVAVVMSLLLAACGSNSNQSSTPAPSSGSDSQQPAETSKPVETKTLKFSVSAAAEAVPELFTFAEEVEENSGGSIKVEVYAGGQLGGDIQTLEGLRAGTIEGAAMAPSPLAALDGRFNLFDIPFLFDGKEAVYNLLDGEVGQELLDVLSNVGIVGLGYGDVGFRYLTNSKKEVTSVQDVKGLKVRTMENPLHVELWNALGAVPTAIAFPELYSALEQNVVDGQENPYAAIRATKLYEVQPYLTKTGHVYMGVVYMVSQSFWDKLNDEEKEIMLAAIRNMEEYTRENAEKKSNEAEEYLKQAGVTITELTPDQRAGFIQAVEPVYPKFKNAIGEELFNRALEAAQ